jgi:hypothetical protein
MSKYFAHRAVAVTISFLLAGCGGGAGEADQTTVEDTGSATEALSAGQTVDVVYPGNWHYNLDGVTFELYPTNANASIIGFWAVNQNGIAASIKYDVAISVTCHHNSPSYITKSYYISNGRTAVGGYTDSFSLNTCGPNTFVGAAAHVTITSVFNPLQ